MAKNKKKRKPKVFLDKKKVFILCAVIISLCVFCLFLTALLELPVQDPNTDIYANELVIIKEDSKQSKKDTSKTITKKQEEPATDLRDQSFNTEPKSVTLQTESLQPQTESLDNKEFDIPQSKFLIQKANNNAKLLFVFDDAGQSVERLKKFVSLPFELTIAVMPQLAQTKQCAELVTSFNKELILHQPMQANDISINPGPAAIKPNMTQEEIATLIKENINMLGSQVKGFNNHEGSLITSNLDFMEVILDVAKDCNVYFLDSRTTSQTKSTQVASKKQMHILERDVFLDNVISKEDILCQLYQALSIANKNGKAIIIGHVDKSANIIPELLEEIYPYLLEAGYNFTVPSKIDLN